jgi:RNA polymerase sigma factor (TIGR02999 family)
MRQILINYALARQTEKRGGKGQQVTLDEALLVSRPPEEELLALDEALKELARIDPRKSKVVELRFFGGLSVEETASVLQIAPITVARDWNLAKAWLHRQLARTDEHRTMAKD